MFEKLPDQARRIAIGGHIRPDGDCVGSCLGLWNYLKENYPDRQTDLYLEEIPECFRFLRGSDQICHETTDLVYDLFVAVDCADASRLGFAEAIFNRAEQTVCIDHHISNVGYADHNYVVPTASSASELVCNLLDGERISRCAAECLYLGIVHDTGVFQYSSTSPDTMITAAKLMKKGIHGSKLIEETYYEKTYAQNRILGKALADSRLLREGSCILSVLTREDMQAFDAGVRDLDGIVSQLRNTKGVRVAIFIYELNEQEYKVSMRSDESVDVSVIAQYFGGGGHKKAAGLTMTGSVEEIFTQLMERIDLQL